MAGISIWVVEERWRKSFPRRRARGACHAYARTGRDAGRIADEVISHLVGLVGSNVRVTLETDTEIPGGAPDNVVRTVTENSRTLKFTSQGFEKEWSKVSTAS